MKDEIRITLIGTQEKKLIPDLLILAKGKYEEHGDTLLIKPDGLKAIIETKHPKGYSTVGFTQLIEYCAVLSHDLGFVTIFKDIIEYRVGPNQCYSDFVLDFKVVRTQDLPKNFCEVRSIG